MASPPTGDLPHPSVGRGPCAPPGSMHIARRDTWIPPYESYCAPLRCRALPTGGRRGGRPCPPAGDGALDVPAGRCGISPYGRFAAPLCRAGPACPAGINAYCAAGHMGPALRIILRPLRCRASPTGGRRGGRPCPPEQREALPSRCEHWRGNPFPSSLTS